MENILIKNVDWLIWVVIRFTSQKMPWLGFEPQTWERGTGTGTICSIAAQARPAVGEEKRESALWCLLFHTMLQWGSLGSLLFPLQDHHVQRWTSAHNVPVHTMYQCTESTSAHHVRVLTMDPCTPCTSAHNLPVHTIYHCTSPFHGTYRAWR